MTLTDTWFGDPPTVREHAPFWLGLLVAGILLAQSSSPPPAHVFDLFVVMATLLVSLRVRAAPLAVVVLLLVGIHLRFAYLGAFHSDVLAVVRSAIEEVLAGGNPYGHGFESSTPPGAPFAYGPLVLLWYLPFGTGRVELAVSLAILGALAVRGRPLGLAVYAAMPILAGLASDGSNDTSAGLFILVAQLAASRSAIAGGALLGVAAAFKPYALAWLLPLLALGGAGPALLGFLLTTAMTWGTASIMWTPAAILTSFQASLAVPPYSQYSLAFVLDLGEAWRAFLERVRLGLGGAAALASWLVVRSPASMIAWGTATFLITLYAGYWSTFAYLAAIAPVICWHLDDWLGLGESRVRWPGDPVARVTAWVDGRAPIRAA